MDQFARVDCGQFRVVPMAGRILEKSDCSNEEIPHRDTLGLNRLLIAQWPFLHIEYSDIKLMPTVPSQ
jgi:hypothetical protein